MELDTAMSPMPEKTRKKGQRKAEALAPKTRRRVENLELEKKKNDFFTLSSYNQACHAVWHARPCCQEGYSHDVIWDV